MRCAFVETDTLEGKMLRRRFGAATLVALSLIGAIHLANPPSAEAFIHEIIAAMCRASGEEVVPPGQIRDGNSFVRALQSTGFITSMGFSDPETFVIHFDPTIPASKFKSAGFDLTIPDGFAPGIDLVLSPLVIPDPSFPAHAACRNLR
jgi:hypothetical protein